MKLKFILICLLTIWFLAGCKSNKRLTKKTKRYNKEIVATQNKGRKIRTIAKGTPTFKNETIKYIEKFKEIAMEEMRIYKIPASITLAQGLLESSSGNSELTRKSNNHFGIKCHKGWEGESVFFDDDKKGECFRMYEDPKTSFKDHSLFLVGRKRYAKLFKLKKDDYVRWAKGLSEAGYATDRRYPAKLIALIEKYDLYKYDSAVLKRPFKKIAPSKITSYIVVKGDTLYSISKKYGLSIKKLKKINDLSSNEISIGQNLSLVKL